MPHTGRQTRIKKKVPLVPVGTRRPKAPARTTAARALKALETMGIDPQKVIDTPKITHILDKLPGGIQRAIEFLRGADDEDARKWLSYYDDIPVNTRKLLPFEAFCVATDITTKHMLEIITGACFDQSDAASQLLAAAAHPDVVKATISAARFLDGHQDRKMMHLHKGFIPVSKNQTTIIGKGGTQRNTQINDNSIHATYAVTEIANIEKRQERIADRFNERLGLGASRAVETNHQFADTIVVEPEAIEPDSETMDAIIETIETIDSDWGT